MVYVKGVVMSLESKLVSASAIENQMRHVFPGDLNVVGTVFGGKLLADADELAGMVALDHIGHICLVRLIDSGIFLDKIALGENLIYAASVNRTWNTSLEVGVKCWAQATPLNGRRHVFSAYFVFVGLDPNGKPTRVPEVIPKTFDQRRRYIAAGTRHNLRLAQKKK